MVEIIVLTDFEKLCRADRNVGAANQRANFDNRVNVLQKQSSRILQKSTVND
ncbi:hypothetical protein Plhal304r1_c040g0117771 [Plasmopara halstedii]